MRRKNDDLGKYVSDKLQNLDQSPTEEIWDKIEVELEKKKQKKLVYYCFLFLLVGVSIGFFLSNWKSLYQENKIEKINNSVINKTEKINNNFTNKKDSSIDSTIKINTQKISSSQSVISETENYVIYEEINIYKSNKQKSNVTTLKSNIVNSKKSQKTNTTNNESISSIYEKQKSSYISNIKSKSTNANKILENNKFPNNSDKDDFERSNLITNTTSIDQDKSFKNKFISINIAEESSTLDSLPSVSKIEVKNVEKEISENIKKDSIKKESNEQYLSVFFGPTMYSSLSKGSAINSSMKEYKSSININTTYGIFYRRMFENFGFRIGIAQTNLSYSTSIPNNNNQFITDYSNITLKENITSQSINATFTGSDEIKLRQNITYYEVPLEIYKSLLKKDSDFGFAIFLGITPQFMDKNSLALKSSKIDNFKIGEASNIKNVNIGFHVGLGLNYKLNENLLLDLNPVFKLQSLPYEDYHGFVPFYFAIQSGLSYKF